MRERARVEEYFEQIGAPPDYGRLKFAERETSPPNDNIRPAADPAEFGIPDESKFEPEIVLPAEQSSAVSQELFFRASDFHGVDVPRRRWLVPGRIPLGAVTILSGDGSAGKTLLTLQLGYGVTAGLPDWLGATIEEHGPAMFVTAEEERDEVHRRLDAIAQHHGHAFSALDGFHLCCLSGEESLLCIAERDRSIKPTKLFERIEAKAKEVKPKLIVIESAADVFGGIEFDRGQARQFIQLLRRLAISAGGAAVILLQHPSVAGLAEGQGRSGSTGWRNSARSMLYLSSMKHKEDDPDGDLRELRVVKANYARDGESVKIRYYGANATRMQP